MISEKYISVTKTEHHLQLFQKHQFYFIYVKNIKLIKKNHNFKWKH